jgi:hypothetical protein
MLRVINKIGKTESGSPTNAAFNTMFTGFSAHARTHVVLYTLRSVTPVTDASANVFRNVINACGMDYRFINIQIIKHK